MGSARWPLVTEESPCHVCGKSDWCSVSADGKKAICRRKDGGAGVRRTDKSEQDYWLYELNGHGGDQDYRKMDHLRAVRSQSGPPRRP
jgi:hypothetical protein